MSTSLSSRNKSDASSQRHSLYSNRLIQQHQAAIAHADTLRTEANKNTWDLNGLPSDRNIEKHPHSIIYSLYSGKYSLVFFFSFSSLI